MSINLGPALQGMADAKAAYEAALADAIVPLKDELVAAVRNIPGVVEVQWDQYTPYFNDGDACTFRLNDVWFFTETSVNEAKAEQGDDYDPDAYAEDRGALYTGGSGWGESKWGPSDEDPGGWANQEQYEAAKALSDFISGNEDIMERAFGDHATITVTSEKLTVEECSHD